MYHIAYEINRNAWPPIKTKTSSLHTSQSFIFIFCRHDTPCTINITLKDGADYTNCFHNPSLWALFCTRLMCMMYTIDVIRTLQTRFSGFHWKGARNVFLRKTYICTCAAELFAQMEKNNNICTPFCGWFMVRVLRTTISMDNNTAIILYMYIVCV